MNNDVYTKTMESLIKRVDVRLVNNGKGYLNWTPKPNYVAQKIFDSDLVLIHKMNFIMIKSKKISPPIQIIIHRY